MGCSYSIIAWSVAIRNASIWEESKYYGSDIECNRAPRRRGPVPVILRNISLRGLLRLKQRWMELLVFYTKRLMLYNNNRYVSARYWGYEIAEYYEKGV